MGSRPPEMIKQNVYINILFCTLFFYTIWYILILKEQFVLLDSFFFFNSEKRIFSSEKCFSAFFTVKKNARRARHFILYTFFLNCLRWIKM